MIPFISAAIAAIVPIMTTVETVCRTVGAVAMAAAAIIDVGRQLGILDPDCSSTELGEQVLCAEQDGIMPENFENQDEYIAQVRAIDVSQYDVDQWDERTKALKAIEFTCRAIADKIGIEAVDSLEGLVRDAEKESPFYTGERVAAYLEASREGALDLTDVSSYLQGNLFSANKANEVRTRMIQAELAKDPAASQAEIERQIDSFTVE